MGIVRIAMYLRLSNEDRDKGRKEESDSISAQRALIAGHVEGLMQGREYVITEFCDDGYSGVDFRRPGVQALIEAAKGGKVDMIVVKDFSRFGRDYLEVGRFLEYIFPILQVRFVSVNDGYDSEDKFGATGGMSVALKNLVYGMYSADLSKKVRSARDTRVRNGEFVGQFAPYGYRKDPEDKHRLLVDEEAARVVRRVFRMAADGVNHTEIARRLNGEGIPTRYMYRRLKGENFPDRQPHVRIKKWDSTMIKDIITDEVYLGTMLWNRARCGMDTEKRTVRQPREKWIVVEDQHEALVSREIYDRANGNIIGRDMSGRKTGRRNLFFVCGYCGKGLQHRNRAGDKYYCRGRGQETENDCRRVEVSRKELEDMVLCQVRVMADMLMEERAVRREAGKGGRAAELEGVIADGAKEAAQWKGAKMRLYERYKAGEISREDYVERIGTGRARMEELERVMCEAQAELDRMREVSGSEGVTDEELEGLSGLEVFDKEMLKVLIEKVVVYGADAVEIVWKVGNPFLDEKTV